MLIIKAITLCCINQTVWIMKLNPWPTVTSIIIIITISSLNSVDSFSLIKAIIALASDVVVIVLLYKLVVIEVGKRVHWLCTLSLTLPNPRRWLQAMMVVVVMIIIITNIDPCCHRRYHHHHHTISLLI